MAIGISPRNKQNRLQKMPEKGEQFSDALSLVEEDTGPERDQSSVEGNDFSQEALSLLEENARLRELVVKLSNLAVKKFGQQKHGRGPG